MIPLGKTLLFKLAKKYNIVLLRCFKVSLQLLSLLIFFLSEVITITCLLFIFPDTHIHTYFSSFLFFFLSVSQSKVFYIHSSVTCSFHLICFGNLSILVPIILLHSFWHLLNIHIQGGANTYSVSSLLLDM